MSEKQYILVLDEGTTGTKAFLFDETLSIVGTCYRELHLLSDSLGKAELDGEDIFQKSLCVCRDVIKQANIDPSHISCMAITNQRSTMLGWDTKTGIPLCNAITWQDSRLYGYGKNFQTKEMLEYFEENFSKKSMACGLFTAKWIIDNVSGFEQRMKEKTARYGSIDSYLIHRFTKDNNYYTSLDNGVINGMITTKNRTVASGLLKHLDIPEDTLPTLLENSAHYGVTDKELFGAEIPITCVIADQHAALFGQRVVHKGDAKCTNGTGSFVDINIGSKAAKASPAYIVLLGWQINNTPVYIAESSVLTTGTFLKWIKNNFSHIDDYSQIDTLAEQVENSQGVYVIPTLYGMLHPVLNTSLRAAYVGISESTTAKHLMRASLEGIAYLIKYISESLMDILQIEVSSIKVDGGVAKSNIFCKTLASILNTDILRPEMNNLTALGAAEIAGLYTNMWKEEELGKVNRYQEFFPKKSNVEFYSTSYPTWVTYLETFMELQKKE